MQGDIVKAAKWFGLCLVISTLIGVIGLNIILDKNVRRLGSDIRTAGSASRTNVSIPSSISLRHSVSGGPVQVDLSPNNSDIRLSPLQIEFSDITRSDTAKPKVE